MATAQLGTLLRHIERLAAPDGMQQGTDRQLLEDFAARHDEAAFAALVSRHGPMVLRVCRRVLRHEQDAEDAFQATFLVLARQATSIRRRDTVAGWLYGVAYRTAMKAKRGAARRRNHEARLRDLTTVAPPSPTWDDVQAVLDEEIRRLPEWFRGAFVLCVLEGKSGPQAAAVLGCKSGTVSSRLTRARQILQHRLARRGITLSALPASLLLADGAAEAGVPGVLAHVTICSVLRVAAGEPAAGFIPAHIAKLAMGVTRTMFLSKLKLTAAVVLAVSLLVGGAGALAHQALAARERPLESPKSETKSPEPKSTAAKDTPKPPPEDKDAIAYGGRVLGPDGRPVRGAKLYMTLAWGYPHEPEPSPQYATTGPDGRFRFTVPKTPYHNQPTVVAAAMTNYGVGWVDVSADGKRDDLTIRLVKDDMPITGQIVDLQGKPVAGATLTLLQIMASPKEDLGPWLEAAKAKKGLSYQIEQQYLSRYTIAVPLKVATGADGRFRLDGIGRNRLVIAHLDGPTIASQPLHILTRPGKPIEVTEHEGNPEYGDPRRVVTYYGADFRHAAAPTRPIVGVVRDKDTGKPLAGITIRSYAQRTRPSSSRMVHIVRAKTDAEGRYRLVGMPKGEGYSIVAIPGSDRPYVAIQNKVPNSPGLEPVTVDFALKRGMWIEGKLTDKATGKPLRGSVEYFSLYDNPNLRDYPGFDGTILMFDDNPRVATKEDGSYRIIGLPGPGVIAVWNMGHYLRAPEREDKYGVRGTSLRTSPYHITHAINFSAVARIDPPKGADSAKRDVTLDPGWTFTGTMLGPDGKPLAGARGFGLTVRFSPWEREEMKTAAFTVRGFNPRRPRDIFFQHREKGLVGAAPLPKENGGSVTVRMEPGAAVVGRLVDADGRPRAGVELEVEFRPKNARDWDSYSPQRIKTDREGRFRIEALLPGREYRLSDDKGKLHFGDALRAGRTKDLGDVRIKR